MTLRGLLYKKIRACGVIDTVKSEKIRVEKVDYLRKFEAKLKKASACESGG
jgi:hypothetical protein